MTLGPGLHQVISNDVTETVVGLFYVKVSFAANVKHCKDPSDKKESFFAPPIWQLFTHVVDEQI